MAHSSHIIFCLLLTPGSKTHTCCPRTQRAQEQRGCLACSPRESRTAPGTLQELTDTLLMEGKKERRKEEGREGRMRQEGTMEGRRVERKEKGLEGGKDRKKGGRGGNKESGREGGKE